MKRARGGRTLSLVVVPDGESASRTYRLSYARIRVLAIASVAFMVLLIAMAGSWWYLAARAVHASRLEREVTVMRHDRERVAALVRRLESVEAQYDKMRVMFGSAVTDGPSGVWLPPTSASRGSGSAAVRRSGPSRPTVWPLTERGFVTQGVHDGIEGRHPGLDIAVPTGSYIRSAGGGIVADVGEDPVYGRFVVIDHGSGYSTLYGHASMTMVELGEEVREREVIALSGSSGRSTGPHLHFEILFDGEPIDPLTLVTQPS